MIISNHKFSSLEVTKRPWLQDNVHTPIFSCCKQQNILCTEWGIWIVMSGLQMSSLLTVKHCKFGFERQLVSCCRVLIQQTNLCKNGDTFPVTGVPPPTQLLAVCKACVIGHGDKGQKYFQVQHFLADFRIVLQGNMTSLSPCMFTFFLRTRLSSKRNSICQGQLIPIACSQGVLSCGKRKPQLS